MKDVRVGKELSSWGGENVKIGSSPELSNRGSNERKRAGYNRGEMRRISENRELKGALGREWGTKGKVMR